MSRTRPWLAAVTKDDYFTYYCALTLPRDGTTSRVLRHEVSAAARRQRHFVERWAVELLDALPSKNPPEFRELCRVLLALEDVESAAARATNAWLLWRAAHGEDRWFHERLGDRAIFFQELVNAFARESGETRAA